MLNREVSMAMFDFAERVSQNIIYLAKNASLRLLRPSSERCSANVKSICLVIIKALMHMIQDVLSYALKCYDSAIDLPPCDMASFGYDQFEEVREQVQRTFIHKLMQAVLHQDLNIVQCLLSIAKNRTQFVESVVAVAASRGCAFNIIKSALSSAVLASTSADDVVNFETPNLSWYLTPLCFFY